jgi:hypothetical protein
MSFKPTKNAASVLIIGAGLSGKSPAVENPVKDVIVS